MDGRNLGDFTGAGPVYVYSRSSIKKQLETYLSAISEAVSNFGVHYAVKANHHPEILQIFSQAGIGLDVVSGGELKRGLAAGFAAQQIIFSGVAKSKDEIRLALSEGVFQLNVESINELQRIARIVTGIVNGVQSPMMRQKSSLVSANQSRSEP